MTEPLSSRSATGGYTYETREDGCRIVIDRRVPPDRICVVPPQTWRTAWAVLRGRFTVEIAVGEAP